MMQLDDSNTWLTPEGDLVIDFYPELDVKLRYTLAEDGLRIFRWKDTERLGRALQLHNVNKLLSKFHSVTKLQQLHDSWTSRLTRLNMGQDKYSIKFPLPIVEGNNWIQPIRTLGELNEEGKTMNHCVASYTNEVMQGESFFYRVLKPERATLELKIQNNKPVLSQLCLQKNGKPSKETKNAVNKWLRKTRLPHHA